MMLNLLMQIDTWADVQADPEAGGCMVMIGVLAALALTLSSVNMGRRSGRE